MFLSNNNKGTSSVPIWSLRNAKAMVDMLRWFASSQIRNVASLAGNLCTASPISDMNPVLLASGATIDVQGVDAKEVRSIQMTNFFVGYRRIALNKDEIVVSIHIPGTKEYEFTRAYKQAKRRDDDISIVNACFRCQIDPSTNQIISLATGFGGMAATTVGSPSAEATASSTTLQVGGSSDANDDANDFGLHLTTSLTSDMMLAPNVPGGMAAYRTTLVLSFARKFVAHLKSELNMKGVDPRDMSLPETFLASERPVTSGVQSYQCK